MSTNLSEVGCTSLSDRPTRTGSSNDSRSLTDACLFNKRSEWTIDPYGLFWWTQARLQYPSLSGETTTAIPSRISQRMSYTALQRCRGSMDRSCSTYLRQTALSERGRSARLKWI